MELVEGISNNIVNININFYKNVLKFDDLFFPTHKTVRVFRNSSDWSAAGFDCS